MSNHDFKQLLHSANHHANTCYEAVNRICHPLFTIEMHLRNIKDKCGLNTKNQLIDMWNDLCKLNQ